MSFLVDHYNYIGSFTNGRSNTRCSGLSLEVVSGRQFIVLGRLFPLTQQHLPVGPDGPVVTGSPIGPCETLSPLFHDVLGPLEHSVQDETILGLDPLEHSGLDHAETILGLDPRALGSGPVGRDVTGSGSVGAFGSGPC